MYSIEDQVVLITGGSRGIGRAIVELFLSGGAHVAFSYRSRPEEVEALAAELSAHYPGEARAYQSDAADFGQAELLVKQVLEHSGRIDTLINNAGITQDNLLLRMSEDQWDKVLEVNLKSVYNLTKHVVRPMMKARKGSIIHMSSVVGVMGNAGQANYAASKAGIIGFSKSIAKELGSRNIRSNVIAPGYIETEMTDALSDDVKSTFLKNIPLGRMGTGADIAQAAAFLSSDASSYISGQVITVCGGMLT